MDGPDMSPKIILASEHPCDLPMMRTFLKRTAESRNPGTGASASAIDGGSVGDGVVTVPDGVEMTVVVASNVGGEVAKAAAMTRAAHVPWESLRHADIARLGSLVDELGMWVRGTVACHSLVGKILPVSLAEGGQVCVEIVVPVRYLQTIVCRQMKADRHKSGMTFICVGVLEKRHRVSGHGLVLGLMRPALGNSHRSGQRRLQVKDE